VTVDIRPEASDDYQAIRIVNDLAFGQGNEASLIEELRKNPDFISQLSLVAEIRGEIAGHILFFPVRIDHGPESHMSLALAPMAVRPDSQRRGIGGRLITAGLERARALGYNSVLVLGHPAYYPRFGFVPASKWGIKTLYEVPDEAFMAVELVTDGLKGVRGTVAYPKEFDDAG
jgi:putative acetyltransferase